MESNWLSSWLENLSLSEYTATFTDKGYSSPHLIATIRDKDDLKRIGVTKIGHLNRIYRAVEKLKSEHGGQLVGGGRGEGNDEEKDGPKKVVVTSLSSSGIPSVDAKTSPAVIKMPPPVPMRKSIRRAVTSPVSPPMSPTADKTSSDDGAPPPVLPRQQSLKKKPRRSGGLGGEEMKPAPVDPHLSPIPQSPMTGASEREPDFSTATPPNLTNSHSSGNSAARMPVVQPTQTSSPANIETKPRASTLNVEPPPKPKPRPAPRNKTLPRVLDTPSEHPPSVTQPPPATTVESTPIVTTQVAPSSDDVNHSRDVAPPPSTTNGVVESVQQPAPVEEQKVVENNSVFSPTGLQPPALPPKKTIKKKNVIIPDENVVFELEDVPMPEVTEDTITTTPEVNGTAPAPSLPDKEQGVREPLPAPPPMVTGESETLVDDQSIIPSQTLPPPETVTSYPPTAPPTDDTLTSGPLPVTTISGPPSTTPFNGPPTTKAGENEDFLPPLPPKSPSMSRPTNTPPLPRRDSGPPSFTPPPPSMARPSHTPPQPRREFGHFSTSPPPPDFPPPPVPEHTSPKVGRHSNDGLAAPSPSNTPPLPRREFGHPSTSPPPPDFPPPPVPEHTSPKVGRHSNDGLVAPSPSNTPPLPRREFGPPSTSPPPPDFPPPPVPEHTSPKVGRRSNDSLAAPPPPPPRKSSTLSSGSSPRMDRAMESIDDIAITGNLILSEGNTVISQPILQDVKPNTPPHWVTFDDESTVPQKPVPSMSPALPPRQEHHPPPPPPITEDDYPQLPDDQEYTDTDSDSEEEGPLISIQSMPQADNGQMLLAPPTTTVNFGSEDSTSTPPSSVECSPAHQTIRQIAASTRDGSDDMILVSPTDLRDKDLSDYMNQEAIDEASAELQKQTRDGGDDYMNQDAIDQAMEDEDEEFESEKSLNRERFTVRGTSPIKSRTLELNTNAFDRDYENQEVLDEDIIPFLTTESSFVSGRPYSHSVPPNPASHESKTGEDLPGDVPPRPATVDLEERKISDAVSLDTPLSQQSLTSPAISISSQDELDFGEKPKHAPVQSDSFLDIGSGTHPRSASSVASMQRPSSAGPQSIRQVRLNDEFDDLDGARVYRTAGTFAGSDSNYKRPNFSRVKSEDNRKSYTGPGNLSESLLHPGYSRHDSTSLHNVPKAKEGFLFKKGGIQGDKPWQKRWVTFNSSELKYFKNQSDKDKSSRNVIHLSEMIDIKQVPDDDKPHRFDLVVINRVFQFSANTADDCKVWVNVLHAAISRFKPQEHETKEGGTMHDPDKQGNLMKQGHGFAKGFKERYVALKGSKFAYYNSREDFVRGHPIHILEMTLASVRPDISSKLPRFVITMNNQKQYVFQTANELERKEWLDTMTTAILKGLDKRDLTIPRPGSRTSSSDVLKQIQENPANKVCADCATTDPVWGVVNLGIMVCIECSGVHRSMGTHISKVRSIELDLQIWKPPLIQLMKRIGNDTSNEFWQHHHQTERLPADVEREIREGFIRAKYQNKSWIPRRTITNQDELNHALCENVKGDDVMETVRLIVYGSDPCFVLPDDEDAEVGSALVIAKEHNQDLQVELLEQNGALVCRRSVTPIAEISKKGHLYKTGTDRTGWKRRYCALDKYKGFQYYKSETDNELLGFIRVEELFSVSKCEEEVGKDPKYRHCFEVNTQGRGYLFCADTEKEMEDWLRTFEQIISSDAAENLGYDKVGYLKKKDAHGYKRRWFTLKGKSLSYYRREREEVDEIDLRKVTELKGPDPNGAYEQLCSLQITMSDKTYHLKADTPGEAESWMSALRHTQVSGIPLAEQQLTSTGIPILIHKCLQFVESYGMETEGLYRLSGQKANIRKLILAFNQDARGVVIDPEVYNVHDVTGTLKLFFRSLPDPLLTHKLYQSFIATMQTEHEAQLYQLQTLIEELPIVNRETLRRVIGHLRKVSDHASKNKMTLSNLVRLFGPTLMTVDGDAMSFANTNYECSCVHTMMEYYKWLFQVDETEEKKEEMMEAALQKIKEAEKMKTSTSSISSSMDFLTTVYIHSREGESYNTKITGVSTVAEVVEDVVTHKALPPNNYALYLVLGDSESHRVLSFNERLLAVMCSIGSDCFLCLKPNTFGETLQQHMDVVRDGDTIVMKVREKKKWKKYHCTVRNGTFIQFKDEKCHNEYFKLSVNEFDAFTGIERRKIDIKNPMPTRYCFWLKANRGEENCRYLCAESEADMLRMLAAIVRAKYPDRLQTPVLPTRPPPDQPPPVFGHSPGVTPEQQRKQEQQHSIYANVKISDRTK